MFSTRTRFAPQFFPHDQTSSFTSSPTFRLGSIHDSCPKLAPGAKQFVAQSISFAYAPGAMPYVEESALNVASTDEAASLTARAVASLEQQVLGGPFVATVLRYGKLYGPGTGFDTAPPGGPVHVDAAAEAARLSITSGQSGIFNIAEEDGSISSAKARSVLGWDPAFRIADG